MPLILSEIVSGGARFLIASCDCIEDEVGRAILAWIEDGRSMDSIEFAQLCRATLGMAERVDEHKAILSKPIKDRKRILMDAMLKRSRALAEGKAVDEEEYAKYIKAAADDFAHEDTVRKKAEDECKEPFTRLIASDSAIRRLLIEAAWVLDFSSGHNAARTAWGAAACDDTTTDVHKALEFSSHDNFPLRFLMKRFQWTCDQAVLAMSALDILGLSSHSDSAFNSTQLDTKGQDWLAEVDSSRCIGNAVAHFCANELQCND